MPRDSQYVIAIAAMMINAISWTMLFFFIDRLDTAPEMKVRGRKGGERRSNLGDQPHFADRNVR